MDKFLTFTVLLLLVLTVTSYQVESRRQSKCKGGTVGTSEGCNNNTSFFKRIYEAYKRGDVEGIDTADRRNWELDDAEPNYQEKSKELKDKEEQLRVLTEFLEELDSDDLK